MSTSSPAYSPNSNSGSSILHQRLRSVPESAVASSVPIGSSTSNKMQFSPVTGQMSSEQQFPQQGSMPNYSSNQGQNNAVSGFNPQIASHQSTFPPGMAPDGHHLTARPAAADSPSRNQRIHCGSPGTSSMSPTPEHPKSPPVPPLSNVISKPPKAPKGHLSAYLLFSRNVWEKVKIDHPGLGFAEIGRIIGKQWRECPAELRLKLEEESAKDKERCAQEQKAYLESPEYVEWLRNKNRIQQMEEEAEKAAKQAEIHQQNLQNQQNHQNQQNQQNHQNHQQAKLAANASVSRLQQHQQPHGASIGSSHTGGFAQLLQGPLEELQSMSQRMMPGKPTGGAVQFQNHPLPADLDDDADDYLRAKHLASTRYRRNHKLMAEVFSDTVVPDGRMIVNEQRITLLRKQVQSLAHHQDRLVADQRDMMDKHVAKKQKLTEDSEAFDEKWATVKEECKPVSKDQYQEMVDKYYKAFEKHVADYQAQQALAKSQQEQNQHALEEQAMLSTNVSVPEQNPPLPVLPQQQSSANTLPDQEPRSVTASPPPQLANLSPAAQSPLDSLLEPVANLHSTLVAPSGVDVEMKEEQVAPSETDVEMKDELLAPSGVPTQLEMEKSVVENRMEVDLETGPEDVTVEAEKVSSPDNLNPVLTDSLSVVQASEILASPVNEITTVPVSEPITVSESKKDELESSIDVTETQKLTEPTAVTTVTDSEDKADLLSEDGSLHVEGADADPEMPLENSTNEKSHTLSKDVPQPELQNIPQSEPLAVNKPASPVVSIESQETNLDKSVTAESDTAVPSSIPSSVTEGATTALESVDGSSVTTEGTATVVESVPIVATEGATTALDSVDGSSITTEGATTVVDNVPIVTAESVTNDKPPVETVLPSVDEAVESKTDGQMVAVDAEIVPTKDSSESKNPDDCGGQGISDFRL